MLAKLDKNMRFALVYLLISMIAATFVLGMALLFRVSVGAGIVTFLIPFASGLFAGQWHYRDAGSMPGQKVMWIESALFAAIGLVVSVLMSALVLIAPSNQALLSSYSVPTMIAVLAGLYAIFLLAIRLGFGAGLRSAANKG